MIYGSVCSGIEAATVAWHPLGWRPAFYSEVDPFPCAALEHHYPDVPNLGDMTRFKEWPDAAIDILVGGTPCQSFSVAGLRAGLDDPRGNLALTYLAIAERYRPRWVVWENVPGVLSSSGGRDFGAFLGGLGELGYGWAYRVLDAQYFGMAQRRRRVFVVGYLGDWRPPVGVLFELESLRGDPAPSRAAGEDSAVCPTLRAGGNRTGGDWPPGTDVDTVESLVCMAHGQGGAEVRVGSAPTLTCNHEAPILAHALRGEGFDASEDGTGRGTPLVPYVSNPLGAKKDGGWRGDLDNDTFVPYPLAVRGRDGGHDLEWRQDGTANAILTPSGGRAGIGVGAIAHAFDGGDAGELAPTLRAGGHTGSHANGGVMPAVAFAQNSRDELRLEGGDGQRTGALSTGGGKPGQGTPMVADHLTVRRLTPRECERLQGFPDVHDLLRITVCEDASSEPASSAAQGSAHQSHALSVPVAVHVLIDSERREVQLRSQGRCLWTASTAESESSYLLRLQSDAFARLVAGMKPMLARATRTGGAESRVSMMPSIAPSSGSAHVLLSGQEIAALANDAERFASVTQKFITSQAGRDSPAFEPNLRTLSCCVAVAISGCIPDSMHRASSYDLLVEIVTPYTLIPYRGKPAADGPRYKALGNSMAVPCMAWIGRRIALCEDVLAEVRKRGAA